MNHTELKQIRKSTGLSAQKCADLVGVTLCTWQRWEGQTSRDTTIPPYVLELFQLKTDTHPTHRIVKRKKTSPDYRQG